MRCANRTDTANIDGSKKGRRRKLVLFLLTLWFQLEDTVLLFGTFLLFDPLLFPMYEAGLLIGSILNFEALLGAPLIKTT